MSLYFSSALIILGDRETHNFCISSEMGTQESVDDAEFYIMADEGAVV